MPTTLLLAHPDLKTQRQLCSQYFCPAFICLPFRAAGTYRGRGDSPKFYENLTLPFKYLLILLIYKISLNHAPTKNFDIPTALPNTQFIYQMYVVKRVTEWSFCTFLMYAFSIFLTRKQTRLLITPLKINLLRIENMLAALPPSPLHAFVAAYYYSRPPGRDDDSEKYQGLTLTIHFPGSSLPSSVFVRCLNLHWPFFFWGGGGCQIVNKD